MDNLIDADADAADDMKPSESEKRSSKMMKGFEKNNSDVTESTSTSLRADKNVTTFPWLGPIRDLSYKAILQSYPILLVDILYVGFGTLMGWALIKEWYYLVYLVYYLFIVFGYKT